MQEVLTYTAQAPPFDPLSAKEFSTSLEPDGHALVRIRELSGGSIGTEVWPASRVMLSWMMSAPAAPQLKGATFLELGSGCGALAMGLITWAGVRKIFASEGELDVLANLCANVTFNGMDSRVLPCMWDWEKSLAPPVEVDFDAVDTIIASDVVYLGSGEVPLSHALEGLCRPRRMGMGGRKAWMLLADRPQGGEQFMPPSVLDEGVDPDHDEDGTRLSAVGRFLHACARRGLHVEEFGIEPALIQAATMEAGCMGGRREFEGRLAVFCVQYLAGAD